MRLPHHLVRSASGIYHFRIRVPLRAQSAMGCRIIKRSLGTRDPQLAKAYAYALSARYALAFAPMRRDGVPMAKPPLTDVLAALERGEFNRYELNVDPLTRGISLRTDGSAADHLAALESMKLIFAQPLPAKASTPPPAPAKKGRDLPLEKAIAIYAQAEVPSLKPNTWSQRGRAFNSFVAAVGAATPVSDIERSRASEWAQDLMVHAQMSKRTAANNVSHVAQLFAFLLKRGLLEGTNPVKGLIVMSKSEKKIRRDSGFRWEAFELPDLKKIFDPANLVRMRKDHLRWAAVMGLYTGARVGEIAQLFLRDFTVEDGIPSIRIQIESDGQTLKTESSERLVPIHPDLVALGLLERVERLRQEGAARLFPEMRIDSKAGAGNAISKGFGYYLGVLGIKPRRANGTLGFHSLRKNVIQELQGSKTLTAERRRAFVGHESGDADVHEEAYMRRWTAEELGGLFPGLTWKEWLNFAKLKKLFFP